jgi:hypothetical protein
VQIPCRGRPSIAAVVVVGCCNNPIRTTRSRNLVSLTCPRLSGTALDCAGILTLIQFYPSCKHPSMAPAACSILERSSTAWCWRDHWIELHGCPWCWAGARILWGASGIEGGTQQATYLSPSPKP